MELKLILAAINTLNGRDAAFERALALATSSGAELYLLHAVPGTHPFSFGAAERLGRMADMRRRAEEAGIRVHTVEQHGDPAAIIELHAGARGADLIVLGAEADRGWWRRRSPVAETVVRHSPVPVVVVPSEGPRVGNAFGRVLVAVDLSPASKEVYGRAVELTADEAEEVTLLHAATGLEAADAVQSPARWIVPEYRTDILNDARRRLDAIASGVAADVDTQVLVSAGPAARTILEQADDRDADLVAVGRSRGFRMRGSTALQTLRRNDRALLVIPEVAPNRVERTRAA